MNGTRSNTRRRAHASSSSSAAPANQFRGFNERIYNDQNNKRKKSHRNEPNENIRRYARRKGESLSKIKLMCSKLGKLRIVDVVLVIGVTAKIGSMLYSRHVSMRKEQLASYTHHTTTASSLESSSLSAVESDDHQHPPGADEASLLRNDKSKKKKKWQPPKWVQRWVTHRMPFQSPLLYRREDDDYSFGYNSYNIDDDNDNNDDDDENSTANNNMIHNTNRRKNIRFKGMFRNDRTFRRYKDKIEKNGYAVVDDILYYSEERRFDTITALLDSGFELNPSDFEYNETMDDQLHAIDFPEEVDLPRHYFYDDDEWDAYYAFDDDTLRGTLGLALSKDEDTHTLDLDELKERDVCTTPSFFRLYNPTCNEIHASLSGYTWLLGEEVYSRRWKKKKHLTAERTHLSKYLSHGYYRDAFLFRPNHVSNDEKTGKPSTQWDEVVFKTMITMYESETPTAEDDTINELGLGFDPVHKYFFFMYMEDMRKDAMVMDLLSDNPRAIDLYSHCAMSSVIEFAPTDMEDYILPSLGYSPKKLLRRGKNKGGESDGPLNDYISPEEKLEIALEMAKALAAMHGFKDGVLAHVDMQVGQFFRGSDGLIKIVDYNRAEAVLYDAKNEKYCKWTNGEPADGVFRAPEENVDAPLTEAIDVYGIGNVFYALLTGRLVWEDFEYEERTRRIVEGETLEIPDSYLENESSHELARAIKACWTYDVESRPSIFEIVEFLEKAVAKHPNKQQ